MKPVCALCKAEMRCVKNEVRVGVGLSGKTGTVLYGDKFECPYCGCEVITGFGNPMVWNGKAVDVAITREEKK